MILNLGFTLCPILSLRGNLPSFNFFSWISQFLITLGIFNLFENLFKRKGCDCLSFPICRFPICPFWSLSNLRGVRALMSARVCMCVCMCPQGLSSGRSGILDFLLIYFSSAAICVERFVESVSRSLKGQPAGLKLHEIPAVVYFYVAYVLFMWSIRSGGVEGFGPGRQGAVRPTCRGVECFTGHSTRTTSVPIECSHNCWPLIHPQLLSYNDLGWNTVYCGSSQ